MFGSGMRKYLSRVGFYKRSEGNNNLLQSNSEIKNVLLYYNNIRYLKPEIAVGKHRQL